MKHGLILLAVGVPGIATAADQINWLDIDAGKAQSERFRNYDDGRSIGITIHFALNERFHLRADALRDDVDVILPGYSYRPGEDEPAFTIPDTRHETRRDLLAAAAGYQWSFTDTATFAAEVGLARIELTDSGEIPGADWADAYYKETASETAPFARVGVDGAVRRFTWAAGVTWFDQEPRYDDGRNDAESSLWRQVRAGIDLTDRWNAGVRYRHSEDFRVTTASLRWRW